MLELKKIITSLMLPPGILILVLCALGIYSWRKRNKESAIATILLGITVWVLSITPTSTKLMSVLEKRVSIPSRLQGDVIVLLGGGIHQDVADLTGTGSPSDEMSGRIITAARAQRKLKVPIIVSGGAVFTGRQPEAPVIRRILIDLGISENFVIVESKSRDTIENARFCREIINSYGFKKPILVTSAYHMKRSLEAFHFVGLTPLPLPAQFHVANGKKHIWASYLPDMGALQTSCKALREYLGLLFYRLNR
jgi:uncharacterized SAM-binding protein YcdF (DUF218 family)